MAIILILDLISKRLCVLSILFARSCYTSVLGKEREGFSTCSTGYRGKVVQGELSLHSK
jgi:hypothetical protein